MGLVAISANTTPENAANVIATSTQRVTNGPTIVKNIHIGNGANANLVNMINSTDAMGKFLTHFLIFRRPFKGNK